MDLPARLADEITGQTPELLGPAFGNFCEAKLRVDVPVPVGRKVGQALKKRLAVLQATWAASTGCDVFGGNQEMRHCAVGVFQRKLAQVNPDGAAVFCRHGEVREVLHDAGRHRFKIGRVHAIRVRLRPAVMHIEAHRFFSRQSIQGLHRMVPFDDPVPVAHGLQMKGNGDAVDNMVQKAQGFLQRFLGARLLGQLPASGFHGRGPVHASRLAAAGGPEPVPIPFHHGACNAPTECARSCRAACRSRPCGTRAKAPKVLRFIFRLALSLQAGAASNANHHDPIAPQQDETSGMATGILWLLK